LKAGFTKKHDVKSKHASSTVASLRSRSKPMPGSPRRSIPLMSNVFNGLIDVVDSRRGFLWIIIGGAACLAVFMLFGILFRQEGGPSFASSSPSVSTSPIAIGSPDDRQSVNLVQIPAVLPKQAELQKNELLPPTSPLLDKDAVEMHRKMAVGLNAELRERTRGLYGVAFQQLGLPANLQEKVIDILTQQQQQLEQQAFEAAQSGNVPAPPSPDAFRAQQVQQDQQLRSVLADAGFAQFDQYRATIPDRLIIDSMNQAGGNLSESQSQQLLQILTQERQQIIGQAGTTQNLGSMSPDQAMTVIQQQQVLLQQAVGDRVQNILTPEQATTLQGVLSQHSINHLKP
jgi:hypothetical protein